MLTFNNKIVLSNDKWIEKPLPPPSPIEDYVTIGSQTWMSKDLAIDDGQGGIFTQTHDYGEGPVTEYYYTWPAACRVADSIAGWRLATIDEWNALASFASPNAGTKLKSTYGWTTGNGTDDYGFSMFPAGNRYNGGDATFGVAGYSWTATPYNNWGAYYVRFRGDETAMVSNYDGRTLYAFTVRLIKDT